ncbi:phage tail tape measure protein [Streptomyces scabiei]|uniref:phage tail tape measure protein n=1 Tax=Streptomyces scabiei TaxID=1930 RepID=UPI0029BE0A0F|nr:phage tail tape measure protein [Streptomyces scabiei]MDX2538580.1 phage tail tape measure protein [Streptomyces scabiei]MDX2799854.1 phage tail tape measure protein [Streptomyces scabiei]MDX2855535.1 phage tail tape measure protein [Streptomyces scabiei]MDX3278067.1 phage tail tape measure protein [Streptomyces scabiei]MDX3828509.1 phage tail tape measure protein [Streptomyces scabiei]
MPRAASVWLDVLPSMSQFRRELRQSLEEPVRQSAARAGDQGGESLMQGMAGKMKAGALAAGAVVGALVAQGIQEAIEKQAATGKLQAQLGLSAKQAKTAGAAAGKLYANAVTGSIDEGAAAVKAIMASGLAPEKATTKQLAAIATKAQDLTTLFEVDLGQAANAAGQAVKTGLAKNAGEAFDLMHRGFQVMGPRADDLADTFNEYSTIFRSLGLDMKTTTGILSQGMKAGARDTDTVADALKEFQIRTTDGSDASADAFKLLKLNAKESTALFAKGGQGAAAGLQDVLDRLRKMKDPVDRNAAAVGLFGTKAEDLGEALFALDPKTAADGLGKVGGAAKKAGDDLRNNAGVEFEKFKRGALMALGEAAMKYAIPPLMKFGRFLNSDVLPPTKATVMWLADHLAPVFSTVGSAISGTIGWLREFGIWLVPLGIIVGGLTLALSANAIATGFAMGVMGAYSIAVRGVAAVTRVWAVAQGLMNAVMALNPFVLVAIAVVALGAALVIAYKKSETFRSIVQAAFKAVSVAALWLWNVVLKPVVGFVVKAFQWWWTAAKIYMTAVGVIFYALGAVAVWLWKSAISPVLGWIVAGFKLWWAGVKLYFSALMTGVRAVAAVFKWLWTNGIKPPLGLIVAGAKLWWTGVKLYFSAVMGGLKTVGGWFKWLWDKGVKPAFNGIKSTMSTVYETGIRPVFDKLKSATGKVKDAFDAARKGIKIAWDKVKGIAKTPVKFIIDTVYNNGIVKVWNQVADVFGAPTLDPIKGFARGGVLPGQSSFRQGDDQLVPMRRGEGVYVSEAMRNPYERARLFAVNKAAMRGQSLRPFQGQGFAEGGIFGWVDDAWDSGVDLAKTGVSWLKDGVKASAEAGLNAVVKPLIDKISGSASVYKDMVTGIPKRMIKDIVSYSGKADGKMEAAGIGGKGYKSALSWARTQNNKPYQWGGNGDPSWDCSGLVSAIESVIRGEKPHRRWATGSFSGATAPPGWVLNKKSPYQIGITNAGVGHTAGTINGVNVESRGGDGVVIGAGARSYKDSLFTHRYGFAAKGYADGGKPTAGEFAWVGEQGPELVKFRGGEEVFNHRDSLRMWEGIGARGFAKGTAAAKARKDIPGDLTNFTKSLTGSASDIAKASKELVKDLKAAGVGGKAMAASVTKVSARLQAMAKQRDAVDSRLAQARSTATDQKSTAADFMGLSNLAEATGVGDVLAGMRSRQGTVRGFQSQIAALSKKGLSQDLIGQLVAMGPDSQLAGVLSGANAGQIKQLNAMAKSGAKLSTSYGRTMADSMFDAGSAASKGFLTGLLKQEAEIQAAMAKLGAAAVKAIRSKKGIDAHSPSRKGEEAGADLGAGLVAGMVAAGPSVVSAAERMAADAVPLGTVPVTSRAGAQQSAGLDGRPLYLVVEDGTVLRAYVSDRVDDALDDVRRSKRSGKKG